MSTIEKTEAQKYLEYHGITLQDKTPHTFDSQEELISFIQGFADQEVEEQKDIIKDLNGEKEDLEEKIELLEANERDASILNDEIDTLTRLTEGLKAETPIDDMKLDILRRLFQHLTLEELEVIEAQQEALFKKFKKPYVHY